MDAGAHHGGGRARACVGAGRLHEGRALRAGARGRHARRAYTQLAAADGCMAGDEETELYKRRCAVHHQPRAHRLETTTDAQRRFWHAHDNHAGSRPPRGLRRALCGNQPEATPSSVVSMAWRTTLTPARAAWPWRRGVGASLGDATAVADAHHLFCELLRAHWAVEEKDSGAFADDLRQKVGNATWAALRRHERLPFKSFKACQRTGRCLRVHAMWLFGVARFRGVAAVLDAANALAPTAGARVAHVFNDGLMSWPKLVSAPRSPDSAGGGPAPTSPSTCHAARPGFLDAITRWRNALPDPARACWPKRDVPAPRDRVGNPENCCERPSASATGKHRPTGGAPEDAQVTGDGSGRPGGPRSERRPSARRTSRAATRPSRHKFERSRRAACPSSRSSTSTRTAATCTSASAATTSTARRTATRRTSSGRSSTVRRRRYYGLLGARGSVSRRLLRRRMKNWQPRSGNGARLTVSSYAFFLLPSFHKSVILSYGRGEEHQSRGGGGGGAGRGPASRGSRVVTVPRQVWNEQRSARQNDVLTLRIDRVASITQLLLR